MTKINALKPDKKNANRGTKRGKALLSTSLQNLGAGRSILIDKNYNIIAGNKTLETAGELGIDDIQIVPSDGTKVIAVMRTDLDLYDEHDPRARQLAYADNRVGQVDLEFDPEQIVADLDKGLDLSDYWFEDELVAIIEQVATGLAGEVDGGEGDDNNNYSREIKSPDYVPTGNKPSLGQLSDTSVTDKLIKEINEADIPESEKAFLRIAAQRHTVLNFKHIAEYYAHSDKNMQGLMENSALVIIDFNKAISLGLVELTKEISELVKEEYGDD